MTLKSDAIFKEKPTGCLKNDTTNLVSFHASFWKSENVHCHGLLLSMAYKLSTKKVQMSYLSWHWRLIWTLKKNWPFVVSKIARRIGWILTWGVESLKICTLMGYFCQKYVMFELKKYREVVLWKIDYGFKNDISNFQGDWWKSC